MCILHQSVITLILLLRDVRENTGKRVQRGLVRTERSRDSKNSTLVSHLNTNDMFATRPGNVIRLTRGSLKTRSLNSPNVV